MHVTDRKGRQRTSRNVKWRKPVAHARQRWQPASGKEIPCLWAFKKYQLGEVHR